MAASEDILSILHKLQAEKLTEILKQGYMVVGTTTDEEGVESEITTPLTPAFFQAVSKFLKDNDITCAPTEGSDMAELQRAQQERLNARRSRRERRETREAIVEAGGSPLEGLDPTLMQ